MNEFTGSATGVNVNTSDQDAIKAQMNQNSQAWHTADAAGKAALEAQNKTLGAQLGGDVSFNSASGTWSGTAGSGYAPVQSIYGGASQEAYVGDIYKAQQDAALAALKGAYDQNIIDINAQGAKIPQTYQTARNQTAATSEQQKANWNEYAAGSGLNTGAGAQGTLAMNNQLLGSMGNINTAEADAISDLDTQRLKIQTQYENAIAQAIAEGNMAKAQALYSEKVRVDENLISSSQAQAGLDMQRWGANTSLDQYNQQMALEMAQQLAKYGIFDGYKGLLPDEQIAAMQAYWQQQNGKSGGYSGGYSGGGNGGTDATVSSESVGNGESAFYNATGNYRYGEQGNTFADAEYGKFLKDVGMMRTDNGRVTAISDAYHEGKISEAQAQQILGLFGLA